LEHPMEDTLGGYGDRIPSDFIGSEQG
jgi:hypothetical protein